MSPLAKPETVTEQATVTAAELEQYIKDCGRRIESSYTTYERTGCFGAKGEADRWLRLQNEAIRARSPETVRRMEAERGIA